VLALRILDRPHAPIMANDELELPRDAKIGAAATSRPHIKFGVFFMGIFFTNSPNGFSV